MAPAIQGRYNQGRAFRGGSPHDFVKTKFQRLDFNTRQGANFQRDRPYFSVILANCLGFDDFPEAFHQRKLMHGKVLVKKIFV